MSNKKLNKNNVNNKKEMSESDKINKSNNVSNKEALKDKIHEIHNYLRNNGAGYGMNALKVFNLLYGLKKIEEKNLIGVANLQRPECEFSYLLNLAKENEDEFISNLIKGIVLTSISESNIRELLFYEIPVNISGRSLSYLIKEIEKITIIEETCNVLLSGKIYEYFIGRDESAISELGAYFTDRHIVDYIYKKLDPLLNVDKSIDSMIDMFGGSGGFTTGYINYLNQKYKNIDWSKNINQIYHYDMNSDVVKSAGLEIFCLTGELPNMENNVIYNNSFQCEYKNKKFEHIVTNPPYGGDKTKKSADTIKREKLKEFIKKDLLTLTDELKIEARNKQLKDIDLKNNEDKIESDKYKVTLDTCSMRIRKFAKKHKLKANDKEAVSLILIMDLLAADGVAIGVLKEGVFFNSTYKNIRKCLVENFNVTEVISVPQDQFENTSTKTSILIFNNKRYDENELVKFSELKIKKYSEDKFEEFNNNIFITENKGDICDIEEELVSEANKYEIINNKTCSLNGKDYNKTELKIGKDYKLVKLSDLCQFLPKSKRKASFGKKEGIYNFYTSSDKVQKCDFADYYDECLIIGSGGVPNIKIDSIFSCSADNILITSEYNKYLYYLIIGNMKLLSDGFSGSVLKHLSKDYLKNLQIPIPKDENRITYWVDKISKPYDEKNEAECQLKELEDCIKDKIKNICENEDCEEVKLVYICKFIKCGKNKTPDNKKGKLYPYYGTSGITGYTDHYLFDGNFILIARNGTMGNCFLTKGRIYPSDHIFILKIKDNYNIKYIYSLIQNSTNIIKENSNGSIIDGISKEALSNIKINIPKDNQLITNLEPLFEKIEELQNNIKSSKLLYKQYIKELSEEAIIT